MMKRICTYLFAVVGIFLPVGLFVACVDELDLQDNSIEEGLPATVELTWTTEMQAHLSRAQLTDKEASHINTLWIGIYDYADGSEEGELLHQELLSPNVAFSDATLDVEQKTVRIPTTSGKRRIVAVANVHTNYGITDNEALRTSVTSENSNARLWRLSDLLAKADTWAKFRSISACLTDSSSLAQVSSNLVMAGVYYKEKSDHPTSWINGGEGIEGANEECVEIREGDNKLPGAIHLRRLKSYVRFNFMLDPGVVKIGNGTEQPIKDMAFEPVSWQVFNVPIISYLHEQGYNAADKSKFFVTALKIPDNYATSAISYTFQKGPLAKADGSEVEQTGKEGTKEQAEGLWFDFYLYENKRMGVSENVKTYADREREYKNEQGANTGVYKSLCPSKTETANNYGTFVAVKLKVTYSYQNEANETVQRTAYPVYTIHLGFCEGNDEKEKARDFNCRRNSRYTYNVRIVDVDKIKVEAENQEGEPQPGAEGDVIDVFENLVTLDAHYCVWNVKLTNKQREGLTMKIRAYFDGNVYNFEDKEAIDDALRGSDKFKRQLVDWITVMPTTGEKDIPKYQPTWKEEGGSWTLDKFDDPVNYPHTSRQEGDTDDKEYWYTLFFNEYVYDYDRDGKLMLNTKYDKTEGDGEGGWEHYVNEPDRILWLNVKPNNVSSDKESSYSKSLYVFTQKSIQTYYSIYSFTPNGTALGMEHINETFGLNLRWTWQNGALNTENGRINVSNYVESLGKKWEAVVGNQLLVVPPITRQGLNVPETMYSVWGLVQNDMEETQLTDPQPDDKRFIEMMSACMNRNRDNNGNGVIDPEELRWYVPTTGKYLRLIIGRESMVVPLMDYIAAGKKLTSGTLWAENAKNTRFHYFTSNKQILWSEEGLSISEDLVSGKTPSGGNNPWAPWQVRCVRNLGINHEHIATEDPVRRAYDHDATSRTIDLKYYKASSLRAGIGAQLPVHIVNEDANKLSRKFQYAKTPMKLGKGLTPKKWKDLVNGGKVCSGYSENGDAAGWRIPNQKELAVMRQLGILNSHWGKIFLTCTQEYFEDEKRSEKRFMGADPGHSYAVDVVEKDDYYVWCVRDVIEGSRGGVTRE